MRNSLQMYTLRMRFDRRYLSTFWLFLLKLEYLVKCIKHANNLISYLMILIMILFFIVVRLFISYWITFHFSYKFAIFLKIQFIKPRIIIFWEIALRSFSYALYYTVLDSRTDFIYNSLYFLYHLPS